MTNETKFNDTWQPCESGAIQRYVRRRKNHRRAVSAVQLAAGAVLGGIFALLYVGVPGFLSNDGETREYHFGGIACKNVRAQAQAYLNGELDPATEKNIRLHLQECPNCPRLIENMKKKQQDAGFPVPDESPESRTANVGPTSQRLILARRSD